MIDFLTTFWNLLSEMAPWLLLGFLFAGLLKVYVPEPYLTKNLGGKGIRPIIRSVLIGIPLPLCSCGVIPTAIALNKKGASKAATNGFLIATPQTGVDSIMATYSMLGLPFAIIRPIVALISGVFGGWLTSFWAKDLPQNEFSCVSDEVSTPSSTSQKIKQVFAYGFFTLLQDILNWLFLGLILATAISIWVPEDFFTHFSKHSALEFLFVLIFSIPLYVCATGSIPIGLSLLMKGISPGAILVFLMAGPATNIATLVVMNKALGRKATISYLVSIIISAVVFGLLLNEFLPASYVLEHCSIHDASERSIVYEISAAVLVGLMLTNAWIKYTPKLKVQHTMQSSTKVQKVFLVEGMTCNHCKNSVEKHLGIVEGVDRVEVDLATGKVLVEGTYTNETIQRTIEELGYTFKGEVE